MATMFEEYDVVRVKKLLTPSRSFDGSQDIARAPKIGDEGAIVHLSETNDQTLCVVECVNKEGRTVWLADFVPEELELVWKAPRNGS